MDRTLGDLLAGFERAAAEAEPTAIATLLGDLERLKALLWHRLAAQAARAAPAPRVDGEEELRHLTPQQVSTVLNLKPAYVHELCRAGKLPARKSGKYWLIPLVGLRRWLESPHGHVDAEARARLESLNPRRDSDLRAPATPRCRARRAPTS